MTVSDRDDEGNWRDPNADILLDKQQKAEGSVDSLIDSSPDPLFHTVRPEKLELRTYKAFIELLDNYDAIVNNEEFLDGKELREINEFLDAILETKCMHICFDYITQVLGVPYTWGDYKRKLFAMWFEIHNLRVDEVAPPSEVAQKREAAKDARALEAKARADAQAELKALENSEPKVKSPPNADDKLDEDDEVVLPSPTADVPAVTRSGRALVNYCSGFEHVYMGEVLRASRDPSSEKVTPKIGNVLGYHNWVKFYIDERVQLVDYLGTKYAKNSIAKIGAPFACIRFRWDQDGETYVKDRGSFFVGISPEFAMAVSTVCYFETYNLASAVRCGWEDRSTANVKFKSRRELGGYIYDYYICREKKYLVSCFQEIIGPTTETKIKLDQERLSLKMAQIERKKAAKQAITVSVESSTEALSPSALDEREEKEGKEGLLALPEASRSETSSPSPSASPFVGPRVVKPKHKPAAVDPAWQAYYVVELRRLKLEDPSLSDKAAFKKAKDNWAELGNTVPVSGAEDKAAAKRARRAAKRSADDEDADLPMEMESLSLGGTYYDEIELKSQ